MEHPPRLHRLSHLCIRQPIYFVTACTEARQPLLANVGAHDVFLAFARAAYEHGVVVGRYVLMPDHLHLFASFASDALPLSDWMKSLKGTLAKHWRERGCSGALQPCSGALQPCSGALQPCSGGLRPPTVDDGNSGGQRPPLQQPYWQKGFFDHVIRSEESYSEKWRYVAENPVRKKLVTRAEDWPYAGEMHVLRPEEL